MECFKVTKLDDMAYALTKSDPDEFTNEDVWFAVEDDKLLMKVGSGYWVLVGRQVR